MYYNVTMWHVEVDKLLRITIGWQGKGTIRQIQQHYTVGEIFQTSINMYIINYKKLNIFHPSESLSMKFQRYRFRRIQHYASNFIRSIVGQSIK